MLRKREQEADSFISGSSLRLCIFGMPFGRCGKIGVGLPVNMGGAPGHWKSMSDPESSLTSGRHYLSLLNRSVGVKTSLQFKK